MNEDSLTWRNDPELKARCVEQLQEHLEFDAFVRGSYVTAGKDDYIVGCALGCTLIERNGKIEYEPNESGDSTYTRLDAITDRIEEAFKAVDLTYHDFPEAVARKWGLTLRAARFEECVFEGTGVKDDTWPMRFVEAIPVGVSYDELDQALYEAALSVLSDLEDEDDYVESYATAAIYMDNPDYVEPLGEALINGLRELEARVDDRR